jgi:formate-dependent nitrite reductase membrane component NrfD
MGLGGALYLLRLVFGVSMGRILGMTVADLLSLVVIGIGGLILLADLGRPLQAWRVYRNPRTSWISVGFICDVVFLVCAGLWTLSELDLGAGPVLGGLPWAGTSALGIALQTLAGLAALMVIMYPGIVLASSPSIPFWNTMLIPLQFLAGAFASALGVACISALWAPVAGAQLQTWAWVTALLVAVNGLVLWLHLLNGQVSGQAGRVSAGRLLRGDLRGTFLLGAVPFQVLVPLILLAPVVLGASALAGLPLLVAAGIALQAGNWLAKYAVIKAGVYPAFL